MWSPTKAISYQDTRAREASAALADRSSTSADDSRMIASGEVPCGTCHGKGVTKVKAANGTFFDRTCESCYGSLLEKVTPDLRGKMYAELAKYRHPQLKSVEMSGTLALTNEIEQRLLAGRKRAQEK